MALTKNDLATSVDIKDLKAKIKTEMGKRNYGDGPLGTYATDFSVRANAGDQIDDSHFNETVGYINKI